MSKVIDLEKILYYSTNIFLSIGPKKYQGKVIGSDNEKKILLQSRELPIPFAEGEQYTLVITTKDARYVAEKIKIKPIKGKDGIYIVEEFVFDKKELRDFKRIDYDTSVTIRLVDKEIQGRLVNFSGGGAFFKVERSMTTNYGILFVTIEKENFSIPFEVIRAYPDEENLKETNVHVKFQETNNKVIQKLCQCALRIEIQKRKMQSI